MQYKKHTIMRLSGELKYEVDRNESEVFELSDEVYFDGQPKELVANLVNHFIEIGALEKTDREEILEEIADTDYSNGEVSAKLPLDVINALLLLENFCGLSLNDIILTALHGEFQKIVESPSHLVITHLKPNHVIYEAHKILANKYDKLTRRRAWNE